MHLIIDSGAPETALHKANNKKFREYHARNVKAVMDRVGRAYGLQNPSEAVKMSRDGFSIKAFREAAYAVASKKLIEAQSETTFGQLLRAGVLQEFNDIYQAVEVTYEAVVKMSASNKRQEFYSPLERVGFPKETQAGEPFSETDFKGLDIELVNKKYGMVLAVERELVDDDQTGQIVQRAQQMGENARIHEEAIVWQKLSGVAGSFDGEAIPASVTYPNGAYKDATAGGLHGSGRGVNSLLSSGSARLSQASIQAGWILAQKMLDSSGRQMVVQPKVLAVSPQDIFYATTLLESAMNPSGAAAAGAVGGAFSKNPILNLTGLLSTRFLPDYAALLIDSGKGFAFQRRDPTEMIQENPQSGAAFEVEVFRYKERSRWIADFIDPKFMINLNPTFASS